ncbi:Fcf2-domain-containing protein [Rhizopus microsporus var. microsporus]|uniref:Fcf2-domain-containing protein n=1 Tax=Rhizopus microsporus var. microsporus TaxID=86635 RepID=A0A1X0R481_RHIZD|nr:Fcf2-domain-containing protein [Rhizopus microsporus var. microsporus]
MTVTRAQRRKLETINQDNNEPRKQKTTKRKETSKKQPTEKTTAQHTSEEQQVIQKSTKQEEKVKENKEKEEGSTEITQETFDLDAGSDSNLSSEEEEREESEESEDESEEEDESEDENLDELLSKAEAALTAHQNDMSLEKKSASIQKLSKMNTGLAQSLYFKTAKGRSKLTEEAVQLVDEDGKVKNAPLVLKANNTLEQKASRKERQQEREKTTGKDWFDMPRPEITPELKRELQILKMRHVLDRKRHYKKMGKKEDPKYFQVGTIIEGPTEFYSARLTKKERKQTIIDELLANEEQKQYYKRKYSEVSTRTNSGGKRDYKKLKAQRKVRY